MKWAHLPEQGGIYDQHPVLMDRFYYIMGEQAKYQAQKEKEEKNKGMDPGGSRRSSMGPRPRRSR